MLAEFVMFREGQDPPLQRCSRNQQPYKLKFESPSMKNPPFWADSLLYRVSEGVIPLQRVCEAKREFPLLDL